jgi:hypothetical protein
MRLTVELTQTSAGQFEGTVEAPSHHVTTFTGTLELLKVLQDAVHDMDAADGSTA